LHGIRGVLFSICSQLGRCVISLTTDHSVGKNPLYRRGLHISPCQLCLRMGTIETCFGKILTASRAPLTRHTSPIQPAPTAPEVISGNLLVSLLSTITSGLPTIRPECELGLGCMYCSPSARFSALHTYKPLGILKSPHATTACGAPSRLSDLNGQGRPPLQGGERLNVV
jgi:hypothetical protein